ncbi:MAG TPA: hypothetical protein VMF09_17030 [Solirubrobacteraceae bacterium]|nr:hypothetical protein [Solirubrobacteraceae bacterium]
MSAPLDSAAGLAAASPPTTAATATSLPAVNQALEPASVRHGSAATQKAYASALAFEQTLVEELSQSLAATSGLGGESSEEEGGSEEGGAQAGAGELSSMLPQALSSGVMHAGGLGLAAQMTRELEGLGSASHTRASASGGVSA